MSAGPPRLRPLRAVRYAPALADQLPRLLAPPYDLISPPQQAELYHAHSHNIVRLILGKECPGDSPRDNRCLRAARSLQQWLAEGILAQDSQPALYLYCVEYQSEQGERRRAEGLLAMLRLSTPDAPVLPHESIRPAPVEYILELTKRTGAQLSPVMTVYQDSDHQVRQTLSEIDWGAPLTDTTLGRERHLLYACADPVKLADLDHALGKQPILIADGHHRYQAAQVYRDWMAHHGGEPDGRHNYILTWLQPIGGGLSIWPTHRVVRLRDLSPEEALARIQGLCELERLAGVTSWREAAQPLHSGAVPPVGPRFVALYGPPCEAAVLTATPRAAEELERLTVHPEWRQLDVVMLEEVLLRGALGLAREDITYHHDPSEAWGLITAGEANMAFLLNPPTMEQVQAIAVAGRRMPAKSTYFHPKPLSGIALALLT